MSCLYSNNKFISFLSGFTTSHFFESSKTLWANLNFNKILELNTFADITVITVKYLFLFWVTTAQAVLCIFSQKRTTARPVVYLVVSYDYLKKLSYIKQCKLSKCPIYKIYFRTRVYFLQVCSRMILTVITVDISIAVPLVDLKLLQWVHVLFLAVWKL